MPNYLFLNILTKPLIHLIVCYLSYPLADFSSYNNPDIKSRHKKLSDSIFDNYRYMVLREVYKLEVEQL